jgi:hypothetical protein
MDQEYVCGITSFAICRTPARALTAGDMSLAEARHYVDATAKSRHSPGTPLSS